MGNGKKKTYLVDGDHYHIDSDKSNDFLSDFPDAQERISYVVDKDTFNIEPAKEQEFLSDFPDAKKTWLDAEPDTSLKPWEDKPTYLPEDKPQEDLGPVSSEAKPVNEYSEEFLPMSNEEVTELKTKKHEIELPNPWHMMDASARIPDPELEKKMEENEAIDTQIEARSPEGAKMYQEALNVINDNKFQYFTDLSNRTELKEAMMEKYGNLKERSVDEILNSIESNHKANTYYSKGYDDYTNKIKSREQALLNGPENSKGNLKPLTEQQIDSVAQRQITKDLSNELVNTFDEDDSTKMALIEGMRSIYSNRKEGEDVSDRIANFEEQWEKNGFDPKEIDGWLSMETGFRNKGKHSPENDNAVNNMVQQYLPTPQEQLKEIVRKNYVELKSLRNEDEKIQTALQDNAKFINTENLSSTDPLVVGQVDYTKEVLSKLEQKRDALRGSGDHRSELNQAANKFEAAARAYYMNRDPEKYAGTSFKDFFKSMAKGFLEEVVPGDLGQNIAQKVVGATEADLQQGLKETTGENQFSLTEDEDKALKTTLGEKVAPSIGGVGGVLVKFAGLAAAEKATGIGTLLSTLSTGNKTQRTLGFLARAAVEDIKFQVGFGADPGEGALFTTLMAGSNKVLPFLKGKQGEHWAKQWGKELLKTDIALTGSSNASKFIHASGEALLNNKEYQYELEKNFGSDRTEAFDNLITESITNLFFGGHTIMKNMANRKHIANNLKDLAKEYDKMTAAGEGIRKEVKGSTNLQDYTKEAEAARKMAAEVEGAPKLELNFPKATEYATKERAKLKLEKLATEASWAGEEKVSKAVKKVIEDVDSMKGENIQGQVKDKVDLIQKEHNKLQKIQEESKPPPVKTVDTKAEVIETKIPEKKADPKITEFPAKKEADPAKLSQAKEKINPQVDLKKEDPTPKQQYVDKAIESVAIMAKTSPGEPFASITPKEIEAYKSTDAGKKAVKEYENQFDRSVVEKTPKQKKAATAKTKQMAKHNSLVSDVEVYNNMTPYKQKTKNGQALLNRINTAVREVSTDSDKYNLSVKKDGVLVKKNGKKVRRQTEREDRVVTLAHKSLPEYEDQGFRDFAKLIVDNPAYLQNITYRNQIQKTAQKKTALKNILAGTKSVEANALLDRLEDFYNQGYIELVENDKGVNNITQIGIEDVRKSINEQIDHEPMKDAEAENIAKNMEEFLNDYEIEGDVDLNTLESIKDQFFSGFPYTEADYKILKKHLENEQSKENQESKESTFEARPEAEGSKGSKKPKEEVKSESREKQGDDPTNNRSRLELPELVKLSKELMSGRYPEIKKSLKGSLGQMSIQKGKLETGKIKLLRALFESPEGDHTDTALIETVLAHEIGHLIDAFPDGLMKRGNILGHIVAASKTYRKTTVGKDPSSPEGITPEDRTRLQKEAKSQLKEEHGDQDEVIIDVVKKIPIYEETGLTAEDLKSIWTDVNSRDKYPELYDYLASMGSKEMIHIMRQAAKGIVEDVINAKFPRRIKGFEEKTVKSKKKGNPYVEDLKAIKKRFEELLAKEITKRQIFTKETINQELKDLTQWWRPFNEKADKEFTKYRHSSVELYADAVGVLFNNPAKLKEIAPRFTEAFFNWFDVRKHPKQAYEELMDIITKGDVHKSRRFDVHSAFGKAQEKRDAAAQKKADGIKAWDAFKMSVISNKVQVLNQIPNDKYKDGELNLRHKVANELEKMAYAKESIALLMKDVDDVVLKPLLDADIDMKDFGMLSMLQRNLAEDGRSQLANPWGFSGKKINEDEIEALLDLYTPKQRAVMQKVQTDFHELIWPYVEKAHKAGLFTDELMENVLEKNKDTYMSYASVDKITRAGVAAVTPQMKGTLGDIENPLYTTVAKVIALINATKRLDGWNALKTVFDEIHPEKIIPRDVKHGQKEIRPEDPKNNTIMKFHKKGEMVSYEVPKYIAEAFDHPRMGEKFRSVFTNMIPMIPFYRIFKQAVTRFNPAWALISNPFRDLGRTLFNAQVNLIAHADMNALKAITAFPFTEFTPTYLKSLGLASKFVTGNWNKEIRTMLENGVLFSETYSKIGEDGGDMFRALAVSSGIVPKHSNLKNKLDVKVGKENMDALAKITAAVSKHNYPWKAYSYLASVIEASTKIAGWKVYDKHLSRSTADYLARKYSGTPNAREKGSFMPYIDNTIPFANMITQDLASTIELAGDPKTRKAYATVMTIKTILPGMLYGLLGALSAILALNYTNEEIEKDETLKFMKNMSDQYNKIPERDRLNYATLMVGDNDGDPIYLRYQLSEAQRFFFAASQYLTATAITGDSKGWKQMMSVGEGLTPTSMPLYEIASGWGTYGFSNESPIDSYWKEAVIPESRMASRAQSFPYMIKWTVGKAGMYPIVQAFSSNELRDRDARYRFNTFPYRNRILRQGGQGQVEFYNWVADQVKKEEHQQLNWLKDETYDAILAAKKAGMSDDPGDRKELALNIAEKYMEKFDTNVLNLKKSQQLVNIYMEIDGSSPHTEVIKALTMRSTKQKVAILMEYNKVNGEQATEDMITYMRERGIVSYDLNSKYQQALDEALEQDAKKFHWTKRMVKEYYNVEGN